MSSISRARSPCARSRCGAGGSGRSRTGCALCVRRTSMPSRTCWERRSPAWLSSTPSRPCTAPRSRARPAVSPRSARRRGSCCVSPRRPGSLFSWSAMSPRRAMSRDPASWNTWWTRSCISRATAMPPTGSCAVSRTASGRPMRSASSRCGETAWRRSSTRLNFCSAAGPTTPAAVWSPAPWRGRGPCSWRSRPWSAGPATAIPKDRPPAPTTTASVSSWLSSRSGWASPCPSMTPTSTWPAASARPNRPWTWGSCSPSCRASAMCPLTTT